MPHWLQTLVGYPNGITTGNMIASLMWVMVAAFCIWLFRDKLGKHLAAWWNKHHAEHAIAQHLEALRRHELEK